MPDLSWIAVRAPELRRQPTDAERALWRSRRHRQFAGHKFRRQVPIGAYIADFACLDARMVVEVDGAHHLEQHNHDAARDAWLSAEDFRVLRFSDREVLTTLDEVEAAIWLALQGNAPHPNPPPRGGRGSETRQ